MTNESAERERLMQHASCSRARCSSQVEAVAAELEPLARLLPAPSSGGASRRPSSASDGLWAAFSASHCRPAIALTLARRRSGRGAVGVVSLGVLAAHASMPDVPSCSFVTGGR